MHRENGSFPELGAKGADAFCLRRISKQINRIFAHHSMCNLSTSVTVVVFPAFVPQKIVEMVEAYLASTGKRLASLQIQPHVTAAHLWIPAKGTVRPGAKTEPCCRLQKFVKLFQRLEEVWFSFRQEHI